MVRGNFKCRIEWQLEKDGVLDPSQAGFRKCRSTVEQVGRLTQAIYDGFEDGLKTLVVYVDFLRAYDKGWKNKLLAKMGDIGLPGCYTKWVQSLLADRCAYVNWKWDEVQQKTIRQWSATRLGHLPTPLAHLHQRSHQLYACRSPTGGLQLSLCR